MWPEFEHGAERKTQLGNGLYVYSLPLSFLLGVQYMLLGVMSVIYLPLAALPSFCLLPDDMERGVVLSRLLLLSGLATLVQSLFGARHPLVMAPSALFIYIGCDYLRSELWEKYSDGDLYAMGLSLRRNEFLARTTELQGVMILSSFITSVAFGLLWFFGLRLPSVSIQATLIALSATNIFQLLTYVTDLNFEKSLLFQMPFFLLILFFIAQNITVPYLKVITNEDHKIKIKIFKLFAVLLSFIIAAVVNIYFDLDYDDLLERAAEPYRWLSFEYIPKDFNFPVITWRGLIFLPTLLSQSLASYCCYTLILRNSGREIGAVLAESFWNVVSPALGVFLPLSVDPTSIGLYSLTQVKNPESCVISGSLLLVLASFLKVVALSSYAPSLLQVPISIYLYAHLISTVLSQATKDSAENQRIIFVSVSAGLALSSYTPQLDDNTYHNIITIFLKNPIILTFLFSLLLMVPSRTSAKPQNIQVVHSIV